MGIETCYSISHERKALLMNLYHRLEKRRQAMLDMPQMIQTWKEVSHPKFLNIGTWLMITCSEDMVADGRSGPNKCCYYE
jgi:hypothetical protein